MTPEIKKLGKNGKVRKRSPNKYKTKIISWTFKEKQHLRQLVERYNGGRWKEIAKEIGNGRSAAQCCGYWHKLKDKESKEKKIINTHTRIGNSSEIECSNLFELLVYVAISHG
jgi:hypothetical protein